MQAFGSTFHVARLAAERTAKSVAHQALIQGVLVAHAARRKRELGETVATPASFGSTRAPAQQIRSGL
ncbi:MAG: hypothetical protein R3F14_10350 [Polyangiaceae bacterium]